MPGTNDVIQKNVGNKDFAWEEKTEKWNLCGYKMGGYRFGYCRFEEEGVNYMFVLKEMPVNSQAGSSDTGQGKNPGRKELKEKIDMQTRIFRLLSAVEDHAFLSLSPDLFSGKVLKALYEEGTFPPTKYNRNNGKADYQFLLTMLNKRNKDEITPKQQKKIAAILLNSVKPYLKKKLTNQTIGK